MLTHHNETLLERYQREHRVYEGMKMSEKHTQGRLGLSRNGVIVGGPLQHYVNGSAQPQVFMACVGPDGGSEEQEANARRLVACWNACDGISTSDLEMDNVMFVAALKQRDRLSAP